MRRRTVFPSVFTALLFVCLALLCAGCSSHSEGEAFTASLDEVDAFMASGDMSGAVKLLDSAAKHAYSAYARIGVYKRYLLLGETDAAEKTLAKGLRKLPGNPELSAVYADFLLRRGRLEEAVAVSSCLDGTQYGSFHAEAVLRLLGTGTVSADEAFVPPKKKKKARASAGIPAAVYHEERFVPLYADAWQATHDWRWLSNAVTICMRNGLTETALSLSPRAMESVEEKLLRALVLYDTGRYADCLSVLRPARDALSLSTSSLSTLSAASLRERESVASYLELCALLSDVYYILGSDDASEAERTALLSGLSHINGALLPDGFCERILPLVYLNSIAHARAEDDALREYALLSSAVEQFPSNRDVLAAYGQFALDAAARAPEDELFAQLRSAGLRTREMEQADSIPVVALEEALSYVDSSLSSRHDASLVVLREELCDAENPSERGGKRAARVWQLLEQEETGPNSYPDEVLSYALCRLIEGGFSSEARELFFRCLASSHGDDFDPAASPESLALWEAEYAAYFEGCAGNARRSRELYSFIAGAYGDRAAVAHSAGQNETVVNALVNLALIQASSGQDALAVETLNKASGRTRSTGTKAEILYRLAVLHHGLGDERNALRALQYALSLNPSLGKARLLLKEIN